MTIDDVHNRLKQLKVNRKSAAYRRAKMAGFTFGEPYFDDYLIARDSCFLRVNFKCVCGSQETFQRVFPNDIRHLNHELNSEIFKNGWDVALELERFGSFSVDHLRADGFSEDAIKEIRYIYDLEDELKRLRIIEQRFNAMNGQYELPRASIYDGGLGEPRRPR